MSKMKYIVAFIVVMSSIASADIIHIYPEHIKDRNYRITQPMPCNWDPKRTTIFGYYGHIEKKETPALGQIQKAEDIKSQTSQYDLEMLTREEKNLQVGEELVPPFRAVFGLDLQLAFVPSMMERDGMPLQLVEIDYKPLNKRCETGFGPGLLTR